MRVLIFLLFCFYSSLSLGELSDDLNQLQNKFCGVSKRNSCTISNIAISYDQIEIYIPEQLKAVIRDQIPENTKFFAFTFSKDKETAATEYHLVYSIEPRQEGIVSHWQIFDDGTVVWYGWGPGISNPELKIVRAGTNHLRVEFLENLAKNYRPITE